MKRKGVEDFSAFGASQLCDFPHTVLHVETQTGFQLRIYQIHHYHKFLNPLKPPSYFYKENLTSFQLPGLPSVW